MHGGRPTLERHPPGDVERRAWGRLESGRWLVANKGTIAVTQLRGESLPNRCGIVAAECRQRTGSTDPCLSNLVSIVGP